MNDLQYRRLFSNLPELRTQRLLLRRLRSADVYDVNEYASREDVPKYLLWTPHLNLRETQGYLEYMQKRYRKGLHSDWGVTLSDTGKVIGTCGFTSVDLANEGCELGYVLHPSYWGRGYMDEAFNAVLDVAFGFLEAHRAVLRILDGNEPSVRFALRHGFRQEGRQIAALEVKGAYRTVLEFAMLREEYQRQMASRA